MTREEIVTLNAAWLRAVCNALLQLMQAEADGTQRMQWGILFADAWYYHLQLQRLADDLSATRQKRQRQRQQRKQRSQQQVAAALGIGE